MKKKTNKDLNYYMSLDYPILVEQYKDKGRVRFGLQIPDLPGVWADGESFDEAYTDLIDTKRIWLETCIEKEIDIPVPVSEKDYSGKFVFRPGPGLHMALTKAAQQKKISLNQYIRTLLEQQIDNSELIAEIKLFKENINKQLSIFGNKIASLEEAFSIASTVTPIKIGEPMYANILGAQTGVEVRAMAKAEGVYSSMLLQWPAIQVLTEDLNEEELS